MPFQRQIHQQFGLGPRDKDRRIDRQIETVELLAAEDIRDRFSFDSSLYEFKESILDFKWNFLFR